ncbi:MAG: folylpolyglutamate synthase/dihydrofolate synthase family protein [Candidatus Limnocylindrales bacterium]
MTAPGSGAPRLPAGPAAEPVSDVVAALQARGRFGVRLGLARTRALLAAVGSPERGVRGALIGGTNGKGSTQAMVASILRAAGLRVGQTPKPHLVSYRERIVVDGRVIDGQDLDELLTEVLAAADRLERRHGPPTEFEVLTTAAFLWLRRAGVDIAVIEVGLGGRLDATNAWDGGVAAITNVGLDHTEYLGTTVTAIAREKAAIIKRGDVAVTGAVDDALVVIRRRAARVGVPLRVVEPLPVVASGMDGLRVEHPALGELRLGMLGAHQAANAAVALGIIEALGDAGIAIVRRDAIRSGLAAARWPGRLELLRVSGIDVLLDGAHNADGARVLAEAVGTLGPAWAERRITLVLGILADKDVAGMVGALRSEPRLRTARVLTTPVPDSPRTLDATALALAWGPGARPTASADEALEGGLELAATEGGPLVVAGSLYLVGHARGRLTGGSVP